MEYLLVIYDNEKRWTQGYDKTELEQYRTFGKEFSKAIKGGHALQPTNSAATVRVRDGKQLTTDGPFAETKEQLGGYYLVYRFTEVYPLLSEGCECLKFRFHGGIRG